MRREHLNNRWQPWRWSLGEVVPHEDVFGTTPRLLRQSEAEEHWLFPGFAVELFRDDVEGYHLNLSAPEPVGSCTGAWTRSPARTGTSWRARSM